MMQTLPGFLVVWSLLVTPAADLPPFPASSHYYWSHTVCTAAQARMNAALADSGQPSYPAICVPFVQENATPAWVEAHVVGPCEPYYDDCGGVNAATAAKTIEHGQRWYALARTAMQDPAAGPVGPRPFLTPEQRKRFEAAARR